MDKQEFGAGKNTTSEIFLCNLSDLQRHGRVVLQVRARPLAKRRQGPRSGRFFATTAAAKAGESGRRVCSMADSPPHCSPPDAMLVTTKVRSSGWSPRNEEHLLPQACEGAVSVGPPLEHGERRRRSDPKMAMLRVDELHSDAMAQRDRLANRERGGSRECGGGEERQARCRRCEKVEAVGCRVGFSLKI